MEKWVEKWLWCSFSFVPFIQFISIQRPLWMFICGEFEIKVKGAFPWGKSFTVACCGPSGQVHGHGSRPCRAGKWHYIRGVAYRLWPGVEMLNGEVRRGLGMAVSKAQENRLAENWRIWKELWRERGKGKEKEERRCITSWQLLRHIPEAFCHSRPVCPFRRQTAIMEQRQPQHRRPPPTVPLSDNCGGCQAI